MANKVKRINLRANETEFELIEALALAAGRTKSAYLLDLVKADATLRMEGHPNDRGVQGQDLE